MFMLSMGVALLITAMVAGEASASHKSGPGGTLTIGSIGRIRWLDPQIAYDTRSWSALHLTSMNLVGFPDSNGAGAHLQIEAAKSFPLIASSGRVIVWKIKTGIQFDDGTFVSANSYRRAWERVLSPCMYGGGVGLADFFDQLVSGGKAFNTHACPGVDNTSLHIAGVTTSGVTATGGGTLRVVLVHAAPYLTPAMAMMWFDAVEANTPYDDSTETAAGTFYHSAGPYYVTSANNAAGTSQLEATFQRNPNYSGPRVQNPDVIQYRKMASGVAGQQTCYNNVTSGSPTIDIDLCGLTGAVATQAQNDFGASTTTGVSGAAAGGGTRFHVEVQGCILYQAYNNETGPMSNVANRRAMSYILNKDDILSVLGPFAGAWTGNMLTTALVGYHPINVFGHNPNWTKALNAEGGLNGTLKNKTINVWYSSDVQSSADQAATIQSEINAFSNANNMNMTVTLSDHPSTNYYDDLGNHSTATTGGDAFDVAAAGWCPDYYDPFDFLNVLFDGKGILPINGVNFSYTNIGALNTRLRSAAVSTGTTRRTDYKNLDLSISGNQYIAALPYDLSNTRSVVSTAVSNWHYNQYFTTPSFNVLSVN